METLKVQVCVNTPCMIRGAMDIIDQIETLNDIVDDLQLSKSIEIIPVKELQGSDDPANCPVVEVGDKLICNASAENVMEVILDETEGEQYK